MRKVLPKNKISCFCLQKKSDLNQWHFFTEQRYTTFYLNIYWNNMQKWTRITNIGPHSIANPSNHSKIVQYLLQSVLCSNLVVLVTALTGLTIHIQNGTNKRIYGFNYAKHLVYLAFCVLCLREYSLFIQMGV